MSDYKIFMESSEEDVYLAIMDKLGVKLFKLSTTLQDDLGDRSWAQ